jgi:hypothetical protein
MDWSTSPSPGEPVEVQLDVIVKAIQEIDAKCSTASVIIQINLYWTDPRVAEACSKDPHFRLPTELWTPGLSLANRIDELSIETVSITDRHKGEVRVYFALRGKVDNPMDLEGFPFDEDSIDFRLWGDRMCDQSSADATDFILRCKDGPKFVRFLFKSHLPEFQLLGVSYVEYIDSGDSWGTFGIHIRRKHWYYFFKVTVLMWLIVLLSLPTFLFEFHELEQRMALTATMFLATAATLYVVGQDLPKTEKLHKIDKLLLGTLGVIFATGSESICVFLLHKTNMTAAQQVEDIASVALPLLYASMNVVLFGWPSVRLWFTGPRPKEVREERVFLPWDEVTKVDPWGQDLIRGKILTPGRENIGDRATPKKTATAAKTAAVDAAAAVKQAVTHPKAAAAAVKQAVTHPKAAAAAVKQAVTPMQVQSRSSGDGALSRTVVWDWGADWVNSPTSAEKAPRVDGHSLPVPRQRPRAFEGGRGGGLPKTLDPA